MKPQRNTKQRQMVADTVQGRQDHPCADQVYLHIRKRDAKISRGTVYRNLKLLSENGEIQQIKLPGLDRFDWRLDPHYHLLCTGCGNVCDVSIPYQEELNRRIAGESGYRIAGHSTVFEGLCPRCQARDQDR